GAIHVYQECIPSGCTPPNYEHISQHHIDHNIVVNQMGWCVDLNNVASDNWVYDNVCYKGARGDSGTVGDIAIDMRSGDASTQGIFHMYNNTVIDAGCRAGVTCAVNPCSGGTCATTTNGDGGCYSFLSDTHYTIDFHNNICDQSDTNYTTLQYRYTVGPQLSLTTNAAQFSNDLYFGSTQGIPSYDGSSVNSFIANPLFNSKPTDLTLSGSGCPSAPCSPAIA